MLLKLHQLVIGENSLWTALDRFRTESSVEAGYNGYDFYSNLDSSQSGLYGNLDSVSEIIIQQSKGNAEDLLAGIGNTIVQQSITSDLTNALDDSRYQQILSISNILTDLYKNLKLDTPAVDQTVNIDANFPGITAAAALEDALSNIANEASQYASQNRRGY